MKDLLMGHSATKIVYPSVQQIYLKMACVLTVEKYHRLTLLDYGCREKSSKEMQLMNN